jgi:hypothetical protein
MAALLQRAMGGRETCEFCKLRHQTVTTVRRHYGARKEIKTIFRLVWEMEA